MRDGVGDVGKGGGALVGRHHQIRIVAVGAQHVWRAAIDWPSGSRLSVMSSRALIRTLIGGDAGFHRLFAAGIGRHAFGIEAALGAHRHDHRILDLLRLHQAQDLGAEILAAGRTSAGRRAMRPKRRCTPSMLGGIDENLPPRTRRGKFIQLGGVELQGDVRFGIAVCIALPEIGPQHRVDHILEAADDAVVIQRRHVTQRRGDLLFD